MKKKYIFIGIAVIVIVFLSNATTAVVEGETQDLLIYLPNGEIDPPYGDPTNIQQHKVEVRLDLLTDENIDTVNLKLFNESNYLVNYTVKKKSSEIKCQSLPYGSYNTYNKNDSCESKYLTWFGEILRPGYPNGPGSLVDFRFTFDDNGIIEGGFYHPENNRYFYEIRGALKNAPEELASSTILTKIDVTKFPPEEPGYSQGGYSIYAVLVIFFVLIGAFFLF